MFQWWFAAMILFIVIVGYGNRHQWYQLPLIPIAAAFTGAACAFVGTKISSRTMSIVLSILLAISFSFSAFVYARGFYQPSAAPLRDSGLKLKTATPTSALVVAADNGDPTVLYYAERKGWHFLEKNGIYDGEPRDSAQAIVDLEELRKHGASYLVFTSNTSWWLDYNEQFGQYVQKTSTIVDATSEFKIYQLNPVSK
jgi:energy-coupling factor transporter transmembrane protein EcfT